jgi:hypothetical protein
MTFDFKDPEPLLTTLARLFAHGGSAKEVAVLANARASIEETSYDNWNGGTYGYGLELSIPQMLYANLGDSYGEVEAAILERGKELLRGIPNQYLNSVTIRPELTTDPEWRDRARSWLAGKGISNQGRVRSDNLPSKSCDGLLFRSQPEIFLYQALKAEGVSFAPLPVFVRGGREYRRIEPDFVIVSNGIVMIVEVDGDTVHEETPAEAHARTTMLVHEGAHVERVRASDCQSSELARSCAARLLKVVAKLKSAK